MHFYLYPTPDSKRELLSAKLRERVIKK